MALSRAAAELALTKTCGGLAAEAGLDVTAYGDNPDCNEPLAAALDELNRPAADRGIVADLDLAAVPPAETARLLDFAKIAYLRAALENLTAVDSTWVNQEERKAALGARLEEAIASRLESYRRRWGDAGGPAHAGPVGGATTTPTPTCGRLTPAASSGLTDIARFIP